MVRRNRPIKTLRTNWPRVNDLKLQVPPQKPWPCFGGLPRWIKPRVEFAVSRGMLPKPLLRLATDGEAFNHILDWTGREWCDHYGCVNHPDGRQELIAEPYELLLVGQRQLEEFCWLLGLHHRISAEASWDPGEALRITLSEGLANG